MKYAIYYYENVLQSAEELLDFGENMLQTDEISRVQNFYETLKNRTKKRYELMPLSQKKWFGDFDYFEGEYIGYYYVLADNKIYKLKSYISKK